MNKTRIAALRQHLAPDAAIFLTKNTDIAYFSGFQFLVAAEREAYLIITPKQVFLLHHSFSPIDRQPDCQYFPGINLSQLERHFRTIITDQHLKTLWIDKASLFVSEWDVLAELKVKLNALPSTWISQLKMSKDQSELDLINRACQISLQAWKKLQPHIKSGVTEFALSQKLEAIMKKLGSDRPAFPTIVAFGPHTALPHHQPTATKLRPNMAILVDFGATAGGYHADMTRSWWFGNQPDPLYLQINEVVRAAYDQGLQSLTSPTPTAQTIDLAVRSHIAQVGFGSAFVHTTGHGLGLDIHEPPSIYQDNPTPLPNRCVFTIEPGIYLPDKFGVRYENTIVFLDGKACVLTE